MKDTKRNIWTLYKLLVLLSTFIFISIAFQQWLKIESSHSQEQINTVKIFTKSFESLLKNKEMILDVLGDALINKDSYKIKDSSQEWLDSLLNLNNSIAGFHLSDTDGNVILTSSNLSEVEQSDLLHQSIPSDVFEQTLKSSSMTLGRTYHSEHFEKYILPVRKAIRDDNDHIFTVITAELELDRTDLFNIKFHSNYNHKVTIIRDDGFIQLIATENNISVDYPRRVSQDFFENVTQSIAKSNFLTLDELKKKPMPSFGYVSDLQNSSLYAIEYLPKFNIWTISKINLNHIILDYLEIMVLYIITFVSIQYAFYYFVRSIDKHEHERHEALLFQANHDALTSLPNRHFLRTHIHRWLRPTAPPFSLLFMDMDNFKNVNDSYGHEHGDKILQEIARRLSASTDDQTTLIRESGDEFIILTNTTDTYELNRFACDIINNLSQPYEIEQFSFILGCSIGVAQYPEHGTNLNTLLRCADIAMYDAKKRRNSVRVFTESMQSRYLDSIKLEQRLRLAIQQNKLFMVYQPQFNSAGHLHGVEALVRWNDDELGFVSPDTFIPIAESCGLMPTLGQFIINTTLMEMSRLHKELTYEFKVAINISVRQITQEDFLDKLLVSIQSQNYNQRNLTLEITENLFIEDMNKVRPLCNNLKKLGIRISLDDFGTGYSSLSMLGELPFEEIKIDKSFIDNILTCPKSLKMVQSIIAIGKNFDMQVLAEGVEYKKHETVLKQCGCDLFQGYLYAKPMPLNELTKFSRLHPSNIDKTQIEYETNF